MLNRFILVSFMKIHSTLLTERVDFGKTLLGGNMKNV